MPNKPIYFESSTKAQAALAQAEFLAYDDASISIRSRLETLVESVLAGDIEYQGMSLEEMAAYTYLPIQDQAEGIQLQQIVSKSLGVWSHSERLSRDIGPEVSLSLGRLGDRFVEEASVPRWTLEAAYRANMPLPQTFAIYRSLSQLVVEEGFASQTLTVTGWLDLELNCIRRLPSDMQAIILGLRTPFHEYDGGAESNYSAPWVRPFNTEQVDQGWENFREVIVSYMSGSSIADIAQLLLSVPTPVSPNRGAGQNPIPKTLLFLNHFVDRLARIAGLIVALFEAAEDNGGLAGRVLPPSAVKPLQMLPLCIKNGCNSASSLAWFRFGLRYRRTAHLLASLAPLPQEMEEEATQNWVRSWRRNWIEHGFDASLFNNQPDELLIAGYIREVWTAP